VKYGLPVGMPVGMLDNIHDVGELAQIAVLETSEATDNSASCKMQTATKCQKKAKLLYRQVLLR